MTELKMWLLVREDLEIPAGKLAVQAGHGFVTAILKAIDKDIKKETHCVFDYMNADQPKIAVRVKNEAALNRAFEECEALGLPASFITDLGRTVFLDPTATVCAVGPCYADELPNYVKRLRLY